MVWLIIPLLLIGIDQFVKYLVMNNIGFENQIEIIHGFFYLTYIKNSGAAWGMLKSGRYLFISLTIIVSVLIIYYLLKSTSIFQKISLCLILGGALGNLTDRIVRVQVVDFLEFHFGSYIFPIFNVADMCIVVGTILLGFYIIFIHKESKI